MKRIALSAWMVALYFGCAATNDGDSSSSSNSSNSNSGGSTGGTVNTGGNAGGMGTGGEPVLVGGGGAMGGAGGSMGCAKFTEEAELAPAAMLMALDMTASMNGTKWQAAQLATVTAIDKDVFDTMSLGLVTFPTSNVNTPQCLCNAIDAQCGFVCCDIILPSGVSCGVSALPQVAMQVAGMNKSNGVSGVRKDIYNYLVGNAPINTADDASPIYEALLAGYNALKIVPNVDNRMLILITDGGFSCTSVSNPSRPAFMDLNGCADWEHPDNVNALIALHYNDASTPINTFIVGVPGSNSTGSQVGGFDTPPYNMQLALSTYAVSGSPNTVDAACDSNLTFTQNGAAPATPCHLDMTSGAFDANALADIIAEIRGNALGCVYPLPDPPLGETIDPDQVNVEITVDGTVISLKKRSDPNDQCLATGCWDYDIDGNIVIIGKGCDDLSSAAQAKVDIIVGCMTVLN